MLPATLKKCEAEEATFTAYAGLDDDVPHVTVPLSQSEHPGGSRVVPLCVGITGTQRPAQAPGVGAPGRSF